MNGKKLSLNIYELPDMPIKEELTNLLYESNSSVRIERIISTGQVSEEWYNQEEQEWLVLVEGCSTIEYDDGAIIELAKGDTLYIPAHRKHRVTYTQESPACIWICVFWK